ncbi:hypothetical protein BH11MYX2_BH11MYX2_21330 [soil metagenome]
MNDPVLKHVADAMVTSGHDPVAARRSLDELWNSADDPLHRCAIAVSMAGLQESVSDELTWDLRALEAGRLLDDVRLVRAGMAASVNALLSSLHANLADVYRRIDAPHEHGPGCNH